MKAEWNVLWSKESKVQFDRIIGYLRENWTEKEVKNFILQIRNFERIVVNFPDIYPESGKKVEYRKAVLSKHNSVIYKIDREKSAIRVFTIFDNRQHPGKLK
jgi:plasmid stabilization system protein ParE